MQAYAYAQWRFQLLRQSLVKIIYSPLHVDSTLKRINTALFQASF
jgi:hypothetical protein